MKKGVKREETVSCPQAPVRSARRIEMLSLTLMMTDVGERRTQTDD
jgi:hypothetical protein